MPTPTPITPRRRPPAAHAPAPARMPDARPSAPDAAASADTPAQADRPAPGPDDSVEDWYFCGEGSLYR
jgi:hypothetical protein